MSIQGQKYGEPFRNLRPRSPRKPQVVQSPKRAPKPESDTDDEEVVNDSFIVPTTPRKRASQNPSPYVSPTKGQDAKYEPPESPSKRRTSSTPVKPWNRSKYTGLHESDFDDSDDGDGKLAGVSHFNDNDDELSRDFIPFEDDSENSIEYEPEIVLSEEQQRVVDLALRGGSMFYTGAAGTGKSFLLKEMVRQLRSRYGTDAVSITATTGIAGLNVNGETIHRWAGIGLGQRDWESLYLKLYDGAIKRWKKTRVLIIDEISMMDGRLLDKLDKIGQAVRGNDHEPFGGIQIILTGDFFQLPPVDDKSNPDKTYKAKENLCAVGTRVMAFASSAWKNAITHSIILREVKRQADPEMVDLLNRVRFDVHGPETYQPLQKLADNHVKDAVYLSPTKKQISQLNNTALEKLDGGLFRFASQDAYLDEETPLNPQQQVSFFEQNFQAPRDLYLKIGAQVMLVRNMTPTLVNGSIGKVISFANESSWGYIQDLDDDRSLEMYNNELLKISAQWNDKDSFTVLGNLEITPSICYPVVQFQNGGTMLLRPVTFERYNSTGRDMVAVRTQVPLILSWALSIHKSQGQTLPRVVVDCNNIFAEGQLYVALSRAQTLEHLQVLNFKPDKIKVSKECLAFYKQIDQTWD